MRFDSASQLKKSAYEFIFMLVTFTEDIIDLRILVQSFFQLLLSSLNIHLLQLFFFIKNLQASPHHGARIAKCIAM